MSKPLAIIPCAGFGSRLNMPINKSKELLPLYYGRPLLEYHLELCSIFQLEPHVITRKEKTDLIDYCASRSITCQIIEPKGEWPDTVLASLGYWKEHNILLLPDTMFNPISRIEDIKFGLEAGNKAVFALHEVQDISKWGSILHYAVTEKIDKQIPGKAWGVIGFNNVYGVPLFQSMTTRNNPFPLTDVGFVSLNKFDDLTREKREDRNET